MNEPSFSLSYVGLYLLGVLTVHSLQIVLNHLMDRAKKSKTVPKVVRGFASTNPRTAKRKFPIFLLLFALLGVLEAYLIYMENVKPTLAGAIGGILVVSTYMLMWSVIGRRNEQLYLLIIMGGFFISIVAFYSAAWIFTNGDVSFLPVG